MPALVAPNRKGKHKHIARRVISASSINRRKNAVWRQEVYAADRTARVLTTTISQSKFENIVSAARKRYKAKQYPAG
jgi:hypothetical protein